jgi:gluconolactonase
MAVHHAGLMNPEGPVPLGDGSFLLVEMHESRGWVCRVTGKEKTVLAKTGRPNGLALGKDGTIWVCESMNPPSLLRMTMDGKYEQFLREGDGVEFLFPNDAVFGPDGALYMSDSGIYRPDIMKVPPEQRRNMPTDGRVFRIDIESRKASVLARGLCFANGIAFAPDGRHLYVSTTNDGNLWRFPFDGRLGERELVANLLDPAKEPRFRGCDGMKFGRDGNLYVAMVWQGDITVVTEAGRILRRIPTHGDGPTNVCFVGDQLYVTDQGIGALEVHPVSFSSSAPAG